MTLLPDTEVLETERLYLRRLDASDLAYLVQIHQDPQVARYIGAGHPRPPAETERWFEDVQESYRRANLGQLAVVRKLDDACIGRCGLSDAVIERRPRPGELLRGWFFSRHAPPEADVRLLPELGYTFGREHWGQGYATEAAGAVYDYARTKRGFPEIMSVIHRDNYGSKGVVRKFGVHYVDLVELSDRRFERYHWPM